VQVLANLPCCPWHGRRDEGPIFRAAIARDGCALRGLRTGSRCLETPPKVFCAELWLRAGLQSRPGGRVDNALEAVSTMTAHLQTHAVSTMTAHLQPMRLQPCNY